MTLLYQFKNLVGKDFKKYKNNGKITKEQGSRMWWHRRDGDGADGDGGDGGGGDGGGGGGDGGGDGGGGGGGGGGDGGW